MDGGSAGDTGQNSGCLRLLGFVFLAGAAALAVYTWRLPAGSLAGNELVFRFTMCAVIAGVGIVLLGWGLLGGRAERSRRELASRYPDQPWMWRQDWAGGYCSPESVRQRGTWIGMGALLLLLSAPMALQLRREVVERHNYAALLGLVFPAVGASMLVYSMVCRIRERKFSGLRFVTGGGTGVLGGRLSGRIEGEFEMPGGTAVSLTLSCVRSYASSSGSSRSRWEQVLWQDKRTAVALAGGPAGTAIPVDFAIPCDARETNSQDRNEEFFWRLWADAELSGLDLRCAFQVPVFKTEGSDPRQTAAALEKQETADAGSRPAETTISSGPGQSGSVRFHIPAARQKAAAFMITFFGVLLIGSGLFFGYGVSRILFWAVGLLPAAVLGGLGLLLLAIGGGLWLRSTTVEAVNGELRIQNRWVVFSRSLVLRREEIQGFDLNRSMQRGYEVWYDLRALLRNGRRVTVASGLSKTEAPWLRAAIKKNLGM